MDTLSMMRLGLVVPPENPTAEPEFNHLIGDRVNVYASRFPVLPHRALREVLETYNEKLPEVLDNFGSMRIDSALVACSASHYLLSPQGDREFCAEITERFGFPVLSSTQAILALCESLGLSRLAIVSPYEPWLTDISRDFWERAGLAVADVIPVPAGECFDPYRVTTETILQRVRQHLVPEDTALLFTGTGMSTLAALDILGRDTDRVMITSNLAGAWWALRQLGVPQERAVGHPLLERLARAVAVPGGLSPR